MTVKQPEKSESDRLIELQPLDQQPAPPRHVEKSGGVSIGLDGDYGRPVPENPPHLCPQCDYNLTGLVSRRCPECGTPFTLSEARRHARLCVPEGRWERWELRFQTVQFHIGLVLIIGSAIVVIITAKASVGAAAAVRLSVAAGLAGMVLVGALVLRVYYQRSWADAILLAGLCFATIAAIFLVT